MNAQARVPDDTTRPTKAERQGPPPCIPDYDLVRIIGRGSYFDIYSAVLARRGAMVVVEGTNENGTVTICNLKDIHRRLTQLNLQW